MLKFTGALILSALICASTAIAGGNANQQLCAKNWPSVQSGSGGSFTSLKQCASSKDVFAPSLVSSTSAVGAGQVFVVTGQGFHPVMDATFAFSAYGQPPYYSVPGITNADGSFIGIVAFTACGAESVLVTITVTDASGVHASTAVTLC